MVETSAPKLVEAALLQPVAAGGGGLAHSGL